MNLSLMPKFWLYAESFSLGKANLKDSAEYRHVITLNDHELTDLSCWNPVTVVEVSHGLPCQRQIDPGRTGFNL